MSFNEWWANYSRGMDFAYKNYGLDAARAAWYAAISEAKRGTNESEYEFDPTGYNEEED